MILKRPNTTVDKVHTSNSCFIQVYGYQRDKTLVSIIEGNVMLLQVTKIQQSQENEMVAFCPIFGRYSNYSYQRHWTNPYYIYSSFVSYITLWLHLPSIVHSIFESRLVKRELVPRQPTGVTLPPRFESRNGTWKRFHRVVVWGYIFRP